MVKQKFNSSNRYSIVNLSFSSSAPLISNLHLPPLEQRLLRWTQVPWRLFDVDASPQIRLGMNVVVEALARVPVMLQLVAAALVAHPITWMGHKTEQAVDQSSNVFFTFSLHQNETHEIVCTGPT